MTKINVSAPMIALSSEVTVSVATNWRTVSVTPPVSLGGIGAPGIGAIIIGCNGIAPGTGCSAAVTPGRCGTEAPCPGTGPHAGGQRLSQRHRLRLLMHPHHRGQRWGGQHGRISTTSPGGSAARPTCIGRVGLWVAWAKAGVSWFAR